ncbi:hypothetical protein GCM10027034_38330 [Ramlibacter solisilvae]
MLHTDVLTSRFEAPRLPGTWKLPAGRALTLQPREAGRLKVAHGQIWATYDGPHPGALNEMGDHVVGTGEELQLRAGQRMVIEAWNSGTPAYFSWDPIPVQRTARVPNFAAVLQPLADLRHALLLGGDGLGRLVGGIARLAWQFAAGKDRETPEERTCRQRGVMG